MTEYLNFAVGANGNGNGHGNGHRKVVKGSGLLHRDRLALVGLAADWYEGSIDVREPTLEQAAHLFNVPLGRLRERLKARHQRKSSQQQPQPEARDANTSAVTEPWSDEALATFVRHIGVARAWSAIEKNLVSRQPRRP